eukprot:1188447-Prorocentrum_minimum.AAC.3
MGYLNHTTLFLGSSCANNGKGALVTPETLPWQRVTCIAVDGHGFYGSGAWGEKRGKTGAEIGPSRAPKGELNLYEYDWRKMAPRRTVFAPG